MYQQGERKQMHGWLQGRFTVRLLDVLVEKITGRKTCRTAVKDIEVVIDFKRPRKTDADADKAIRLWLTAMNKEIADELESVPSYITRMLKLGAKRMGPPGGIAAQRKTRTAEPSKTPHYKVVSDEVKAFWWDELYPVGTVAKRVEVSTVTVEAAKGWWYESRASRRRASKSGLSRWSDEF